MKTDGHPNPNITLGPIVGGRPVKSRRPLTAKGESVRLVKPGVCIINGAEFNRKAFELSRSA